MKLLIVDDSFVTRKVVKTVAAALKMEAEEAEDGIEALEKLEKLSGEISLVLLDWNMPEMNGFDVLTTVRKNPKYKNIPVMMVTTEGQKTSIVSAIRAGADNYLTKPFTPEELEAKIIECVREEGEV